MIEEFSPHTLRATLAKLYRIYGKPRITSADGSKWYCAADKSELVATGNTKEAAYLEWLRLLAKLETEFRTPDSRIFMRLYDAFFIFFSKRGKL